MYFFGGLLKSTPVVSRVMNRVCRLSLGIQALSLSLGVQGQGLGCLGFRVIDVLDSGATSDSGHLLLISKRSSEGMPTVRVPHLQEGSQYPHRSPANTGSAILVIPRSTGTSTCVKRFVVTRFCYLHIYICVQNTDVRMHTCSYVVCTIVRMCVCKLFVCNM